VPFQLHSLDGTTSCRWRKRRSRGCRPESKGQR